MRHRRRDDPLRYTPTTVWATFPWPEATPAQIERVAEASRDALALRFQHCEAESVGLMELYKVMDDGDSWIQQKHTSASMVPSPIVTDGPLTLHKTCLP